MPFWTTYMSMTWLTHAWLPLSTPVISAERIECFGFRQVCERVLWGFCGGSRWNWEDATWYPRPSRARCKRGRMSGQRKPMTHPRSDGRVESTSIKAWRRPFAGTKGSSASQTVVESCRVLTASSRAQTGRRWHAVTFRRLPRLSAAIAVYSRSAGSAMSDDLRKTRRRELQGFVAPDLCLAELAARRPRARERTKPGCRAADRLAGRQPRPP